MIDVGRRPVLILWSTIVAERLGFERDEALTLGRAVASLGGGIAKVPPDAVTPAEIAEMRVKLQPGQTIDVSLIDRVVRIARVSEGLRAVVKNRPIDPASVELYLGEKFGDQIDAVAEAMINLAETLPPSRLAERAVELYEQFRPETSELDIDRITASIRSDPREDAVTDDERMSERRWEDAEGEMPSFRGPQALLRGVRPPHRVEPIRRERTALASAAIADAPTTSARRRAIEPASSSRSLAVAVSPVTRPMPSRATPAHRPTSPLVLILAVTLAGAIGGGVGGLLVAPPQRASVVSGLRSVMTELQGRFAFYLHASPPPSDMPEAEPARSAESSDASAGSLDGAPIAVELSTSLAPATAVVPPSGTVNEMPAYPPVDNDGASEVARMEPSDKAPEGEPAAVEISPPLAPETAVVPPSTTVMGTPAYAPGDRHDASEVARIGMERGDERMRQGDVVAARRFYQMAADAGMVQAATAIGRTFDPVYLRHIRVRGAFADAQRAKQWYENAAKAGDMEALARIELMTWDSSRR
jgi:hypothetical protein